MSEPHRIIEKEIGWNDFADLILNNEISIAVFFKHESGNFMFPRIYRLIDRDIRIKDNEIEFYNGPYLEISLLKEHNENISYGIGDFYLTYKRFDYLEDEDLGLFKKLDSFNLETVKIQLLEIKKI